MAREAVDAIFEQVFSGYARWPLNSVRRWELRGLIDDAIREAVAAEREACARMAEEWGSGEEDAAVTPPVFEGRYGVHPDLAAAIRARTEGSDGR